MTAEPVEKLLVKPVADPIVATLVLLLTQVPPEVESKKIVEAPKHKEDRPVIAEGLGLTVIVSVPERVRHPP
jgi:hypothetical protein